MKRAIDIVGSFIALVLLSPVLLVIAVAILIDDWGPVFFVQERVGLRRRRFPMVKFRTMRTDAEARLAEIEELNEVKGAAFKMQNDPRVTRVGHVLRKLSLDELPQFLNVLRGDMSLVGPRPLPVRDVLAFQRVLAATPVQRSSRTHMPVAGQRAARYRLRALDGAGPAVHRQLVAVSRHRYLGEDVAGGPSRDRSELIETSVSSNGGGGNIRGLRVPIRSRTSRRRPGNSVQHANKVWPMVDSGQYRPRPPMNFVLMTRSATGRGALSWGMEWVLGGIIQ